MTKMIAVRVDDAFGKSLDAACRRTGLSRSAAVKQAVEHWIRAQRMDEARRRDREGYAKKPVKADEFGPVLGAGAWPK